MRRLTISMAVGFLFIFSSVVSGKEYVIKFATIAPEGSTWMKVLKEFGQEIQEKSGGQMRFRIYPGGVSGDEKDVLRKMRIGQIHCAGFTGVGFGEILPEVRVIDLPFIFRNYGEVDYIQEKMYERFAAAFEEKGFVLLGWAEVGFVHFFSNKPIYSMEDVKHLKIWMWEGDPLAVALFKALGVSPIPLSVIDVLSSLQTGLINAVYISPLGAIALQWFTKVKYMTEFPISDAAGAVLITKRYFDRLPENLQLILKESARNHLTRLIQLTRMDNVESVEILKENGIQITPTPPDSVMAEFYGVGERAREKLVGKMYSRELLNELLFHIEEFRSKQTPIPNTRGHEE